MVTVYVPGSNPAKVKYPVALLVTMRESFELSLTSVTLAPGMLAPVVSATVPERLAVVCAHP
jgi:hypothetical protein